jgi:hypothetical protein
VKFYPLSLSFLKSSLEEVMHPHIG